MIIIKEKKQPLDEMAQFKGAGITVEVRSNDHGVLGNVRNPAHAHVLDSSGGKEQEEIVITLTLPEKASDVVWYRTPNIPDGLGNAVVKFAELPNAALKKTGVVSTNWQIVVGQWLIFHGK
jgi:hypothetical protein